MMNCLECGAVISFLHDVPDCFVMLCKLASQTTSDLATVPLFIGVITSWAYTRMYVFPHCIYLIAVSGLFSDLPYVLPIYIFFLSCLVVLHYYWYSIFMKILYALIFAGETEDLQNKIEVDEHHTNAEINNKEKTQ